MGELRICWSKQKGKRNEPDEVWMFMGRFSGLGT